MTNLNLRFMQSVTFLVQENQGKIPTYNVIPTDPQTGRTEDPNDSRGTDIDALFPSHGKPIICMEQIQDYSTTAIKGLVPTDGQFPLLRSVPGANSSWFCDMSLPRVDLSVYETQTDEYTNTLVGLTGQE